MTKSPMDGIYTPNITPIDSKGRVDEDKLIGTVELEAARVDLDDTAVTLAAPRAY